MPLKFGTALRDARANSIESTAGAAPLLRVYSGAPPTNPGDAASGTLLAELTLPSSWLTASSGGVVTKDGTWTTGVGGAATSGTAGYFRVLNAAGSVVHIQGNITTTGGGGDMTLDSVVITAGQSVTINTFTLTEGNS